MSIDCNRPTCICGYIEDNQHILLHCHKFNWMRRDLFSQLNILGRDIKEVNCDAFSNLLLFGNWHLSVFVNKTIIESKTPWVYSPG